MVSQYIHQWSEGEIHCGLNEATTNHPELIDYSCYALQLTPFIETFGKSSILPVFFDRVTRNPQNELERVCSFIGYQGKAKWYDSLSHDNVSAERVRKFPLHNLLVDNPVAATLRSNLVPKRIRTRVRQFFSMTERPKLEEQTKRKLEEFFDKDLEVLGRWLGVPLNCRNFRTVTAIRSLDWV
jgi:hypothetical protein